jgi:hypothetical protein
MNEALPKLEQETEKNIIGKYKDLLPKDTYEEMLQSYKERKLNEQDHRYKPIPYKEPMMETPELAYEKNLYLE